MTSRGLEAYKASLAPIVPMLPAEEAKALDSAVSDLDPEKLNARYPDGSVRDIIRGEARRVLVTYPGLIKDIAARHCTDASSRAQLSRISGVQAQFLIDSNVFVPQPKIRAPIVHASACAELKGCAFHRRWRRARSDDNTDQRLPQPPRAQAGRSLCSKRQRRLRARR